MYGLKEWDVVCQALERGWSTILLRAGGIRDRLRWVEELPDEMCLMPNDFHEQLSQVTRVPEGFEPASRWTIRSRAKVVKSVQIRDVHVLEALAPFHILSPELVEKRFTQQEPHCIWMLMLRVYTFERSWKITDTPSLSGCRSVVELPEPAPLLRSQPVMEDEQFNATVRQIDGILNRYLPDSEERS